MEAAETLSPRLSKRALKKKPVEKWYHFQLVSQDLAILRGSSSISDRQFKPLSRGKQASASSVVAIVYAHLFELKDWDSSVVDRLLDYGDRLFRVSKARGHIADDVYMSTSLLEQEFFVGDYKCKVCTEPGFMFGNLFSETAGAPKLCDGLAKFLEVRNFGVLTSQGMSVAVWYQETDGYLYFEPAASDEQGKRQKGNNLYGSCCKRLPNGGVACVVRSSDVKGLLQVFLSSLDGSHDSRYCIDRVSVIRVKPIVRGKFGCGDSAELVFAGKQHLANATEADDSKHDCTKTPSSKPVESCCSLQRVMQKIPLLIEMTNCEFEARFACASLVDRHLEDERYSYEDVKANVPPTFGLLGDVAILHGWSSEVSDAYKARGAQTAANCVVAFAMRKVNPVKTWLRQTLDDILALGDVVYADLKAVMPSISNMVAMDLSDATLKIEDKKLRIVVDLMTVVGTITSKNAKVLNLRQGLEEFFAKESDGALECSSAALAVWKEDDYYYQFDSKACDVNGVHTADGDKNNGKDKKAEESAIPERQLVGKCCVMRFPDLGALCAHFMRNLEPAKNCDRFTVRRVQVLDDVPGIRDWNSFKPAAVGKSWILSGTVNGADESMDDRSRGQQGLAIPVMAVVAVKYLAPSHWSKHEVDDVVREGDDYYCWCIPPAGEGDEEEKQLTVKSLKKHFYFEKCKVPIEVKESCVVGTLSKSSGGGVVQAVKLFFENQQFGIVESNDRYFAVWKLEEELRDKSKELAYYLFSDKPSDAFLKRAVSEPDKLDSSACVLRFLEPRELAVLLEEELRVGEDEENAKSEFHIHEVIVGTFSAPMTNEEISKDKSTPARPELGAYTAVGDDAAILSGSFGQANEMLFRKETRDRQQSANALVALAMTKLFDPFLWYREVLDDVLKMGDKLSEQNAKNISDMDDEEEDEVSNRDYLLPGEIERDFFIGVNEISVEVEDESGTGKIAELAKVVEDFFGQKRMGVFRQEKVILPIWRDDSITTTIYFTMDPRGKRNGTSAAVYWYTDVQLLVDYLTECCEKPDGNFVIDGVSVDNKVAEAEQSEEEEAKISDEHWYNFASIAEGAWKMDANVSMADESFQPDNRGKQSAAMALMAIVFFKVYEPRYLTPQILDEITITGDKLHSRSAARLGENRSLQPNEVISEFFIANRRINLNVRDCVQAGKLSVRSAKIQDVAEAVAKFFQQFDFGCLTVAQSQSCAILKHDDDHYYCFSPGVALARYESLNLLTEQLQSCGDADADFEVTSVNIVDWNKSPPWKYDPSPAVRPTDLPALNAYRRLPGRARAILRGHTHQGSDIFSEATRNRQTAANCVTCLAMSVIKNPTTWTRKTLDQILVLGDNVHRESLKFTNKATALKPKDIVRIFHVGVNVLAADVQAAIVSGIVDNPPPETEETKDKKGEKDGKKKAAAEKDKKKDKKKDKSKKPEIPPPPPILLADGLKRYFENNTAGILVTGRFMLALWKESGVYFMYDPRSRDRLGMKNDEAGTCCVIWFACLEPLFDSILANLEEDERYARFEISRLVIKTVQIEPLPCPAGYKAIKENASPPKEAECPAPPILPADIQSSSANHLNVDLETSFERVDSELSILLAGTHIAAGCFNVKNRGLQSTAVAAVAVAVSSLHAPSTWTPRLIDAILKHGDTLHTECARLSCPGARNLSPSELLDVFVVGDVRVRMLLRRDLAAGITLEHDLAGALRLFFAKNRAGVMHTASYALAVMEHWGKFYFLDPSEKNKFKADSFEGVACLIKCESLPKLAKTIVQICRFKEPTLYSLNALQILDLRFFNP